MSTMFLYLIRTEITDTFLCCIILHLILKERLLNQVIEGLGILSIYDALSENSELFTLDIVDDVRFINDKIKSDSRVHILNDFNSLDADRIEKTFEMKSISMIFLDTIHTYEQVLEEFKLWEPYMKDDCVMLIDDIRPSMPGRTKWRFHTELDYTHKYDVTEWAHNDTGYGVYLK